jgi:hypothetical protein
MSERIQPPVSIAHPARGRSYKIADELFLAARVFMTETGPKARLINLDRIGHIIERPCDALPAPEPEVTR